MLGMVVDGDGDYSAIRSRYGSSLRVLKSDGPRGHTVDADGLVAGSRKQIEQLAAMGCKRLAIVTDFESRQFPWSSFCTRAEAVALKIFGRQVSVLVADQMFENWLLADIAFLSRQKAYLRKVSKQRSYESTNGKRELKRFFDQGVDYNEVRRSAELFKMLRGEEASKHSISFLKFRSVLNLE